MLLRLTVEAEGCSDLYLFAGVRKLGGGRPVAFESSFGFRGSLVTFGMRKASHRRHTDDTTQLLHPGEVVTVDLGLHPSATLFRAGEELELLLRGRWFYGRFPLTSQFPAHYEKGPRGRCLLHIGSNAPAYLDVPLQSEA